MRNLKKILALVLALVMSLSLMATAGAASFPDVDESNPYATAIDVLDQLKVFQGFEDGTFKPTDTLNRAQAAVLVYRIATGDVEGKYVDNYTYMAQSKFTDLDGYTWAKGYINYCQNAKIVVGTSATTFNPGDKVTGYQLMVMLLRTLGYGAAGEFADPKGWELETAKIAEREGILKNVTGGDFGAPAPRQMVAEILFQGLLTETVTYSALTSGGYTKTGETLGKKNLGLEKIEGIVVANEYANLDAGKTLGAGKTLLRTETKDYTLNVTSGLDEIGEYRYTYVVPAAGSRNSDLTCTGLFGDEANKTWEDTDGKKVTDSGIDTDSKTEKFVNFGDGTTYDTSNIRIKYVLTFSLTSNPDYAKLVADHGEANCTIKLYDDTGTDKTDAVGNDITPGWYATVEHVFKPKTTISAAELKVIKSIFDDADTTGDDKDETTREFIKGEVYVGTQSYKDISDTIGYDEFVETYIKTNENAIDVKENDKGNWLKVIDNNNDGVAEYVFKVVYTMAQIAKVKDSTVTLDVKNEDLDETGWTKIGHKDSDLNAVTSQSVNCNYDDPAAGDVVYYAVIDNKVQAYKAEVVSAVKIDKVNRNTLTATVGDTDYVQSEVHEHIMDAAYSEGVRNLVVSKVTYDLFLDRGGYLAAFVKSELGGNLVLLTDGWFMAQRGGDEYAAKVYNRETKEQDDTTIVSGGPLFILNNDLTSKNNSWGLLKAFGHNSNGTFDVVGELNHDKTTNEIITMVGALDEDGNLLPVDSDSVYTRTTKRMVSVADNKIVGEKYENGEMYTTTRGADTAYDSDGTACEIRALTDTVYYYVYPVGNKLAVREYVGYDNLPDLKADAIIEDVYAVGTRNTRDSDYHTGEYYTADVVVVELSQWKTKDNIVFVYDFPVVANQTKAIVDDVQLIDSTGEAKPVTVDLTKSVGFDKTYDPTGNKNYVQGFIPGLYWLYETSETDVYRIEALDHDEINDTRFVVGEVATTNGTAAKAYTEIGLWGWYKEGATEYRQPLFESDSSTGHAVCYLTEDSKYYTLAYDRTSDDRDWKANLDESDWETTLAETANKTLLKDLPEVNTGREHNDGKYGWNENSVLMLTKSNGNIIWAVSLDFLYVDSDGAEKFSQAYNVWWNSLPKYEAPDQITFDVILNTDETIQINDQDTITGTKDLDRHSVSIEVPANNKGVVSFTAKVGGGAELHTVFTIAGWSIARDPVYDDATDTWTITLLKDGVDVLSLDYAPSAGAVAALYTTAAVEDIVTAAGTVSEADRADMVALLKNIQKGTVDEADADVAESVDDKVATMAGEDELAAATTALTEAKAAYDAATTDAAKKAAMYEAAAAFIDAGGGEADETYAAVVTVARADAGRLVTANTTAESQVKLENYKAVKEAMLTEAVEELAALDGESDPTATAYSEAKTKAAKKVALYDAAEALVTVASADPVVKADYLAKLEAYNTAKTDASNPNLTDIETYSFGTDLVTLKAAVDMVTTVDPKDATATVTVKDATKVELRAVANKPNEYELIYIGQNAADSIAAITSWEQLKVLVNIAVENTDDSLADSDPVTEKVFTKEFTSNAGGEDVTVKITIKEPDDAWKVATDKAALEEALADGLTVDLAAPSKANAIEEIESQISALITKATEGTDDDATVVTFDGTWKAPANVGDEEICTFSVKVTLTSGSVKEVVEQNVTVTVVKAATE